MIENVLRYLNNYFIRSVHSFNSILADGFIVDDPSDFVAGQYVCIFKSKINDGVYKIDSIVENKLVVDGGVLSVESDEMVLCGLSIPKSLLNVITEIESYNSSNDGSVKSESLGDYSVTYGADGGSGWGEVFKTKLQPYRKVFLNLPKGVNYDQWNQ